MGMYTTMRIIEISRDKMRKDNCARSHPPPLPLASSSSLILPFYRHFRLRDDAKIKIWISIRTENAREFLLAKHTRAPRPAQNWLELLSWKYFIKIVGAIWIYNTICNFIYSFIFMCIFLWRNFYVHVITQVPLYSRLFYCSRFFIIRTTDSIIVLGREMR